MKKLFISPCWLFLLLTMMTGCATTNDLSKREISDTSRYLTDEKNSTEVSDATSHSRYLLDGSNYTFAIYNNANQLITYPVKEWLQRTNVVEKPFTDIFIVSHGWDFTTGEAMANYYQYIKVIDDNKFSNPRLNEFRPYFIFIV